MVFLANLRTFYHERAVSGLWDASGTMLPASYFERLKTERRVNKVH
jgi:hypothetical protein